MGKLERHARWEIRKGSSLQRAIIPLQVPNVSDSA